MTGADAMTPDHDDLLADYLGDELSADDRHRFEAMQRDDAELAARVEGMRGAIEVLRTLDAGREQTDGVSRKPARSRGRGLRYAAAIALAFAAGWAVRSLWSPTPDVTPAPGAPTPWERRLASAWDDQADQAPLARSLLAFARATGQPAGR